MLESIKLPPELLLKKKRAVLPGVGHAGGGGAQGQCSWGKLTAEPPLQQQQSAVVQCRALTVPPAPCSVCTV